MTVWTAHRRQIIDILTAGPIIDRSGRAIEKLMAETGHTSTNALSKVLRTMEDQGVIRREVRGRRTFGIWLTSQEKPKVSTPAAASRPRGQRPARVQRPAALMSTADLLREIRVLRVENERLSRQVDKLIAAL